MGNLEEFTENTIRANWDIFRSRVRNSQGCRIHVRSTWDLEKLDEYLSDYDDRELVTHLKYGWPVGCVDPGVQVFPKNHKGALLNEEQVEEYLLKQSKNGNLIGPLDSNPFGSRARFSPINTREKKNESGESTGQHRIIVDLSSPRGGSVNDGTPKHFYLDKEQELHFPTVDSLVSIIQKKGEGCLLYKVDRKSAYKYESVDPGDIHLLGMIFKGKYYFDTTLVMGARHAAGCCHRTTSALIYIHKCRGYDATCFIDDMAGGENKDIAQKAFEDLRELLKELNVLEAFEKACPPNTQMVFLGILFNTVTMTMEVTPQRLREVRTELLRWGSKEFTTLRQVQSLVGKLSFCASTVRAGRLFFSRILEFMKGLGGKGVVQIPAEVRLDLKWWSRFMHRFNGVTCIPDRYWSEPDFLFSADSSLQAAGGWSPAAAGCRNHAECFTAHYPSHILSRGDVSINELETLALLLCIRLWGGELKGKKVKAYCNNQATVCTVNSGRAKNSFAQGCLRELFYWCAWFDCQLRVEFIGTKQNRLADLLSRPFDNSCCQELEQIIRADNVKV